MMYCVFTSECFDVLRALHATVCRVCYDFDGIMAIAFISLACTQVEDGSVEIDKRLNEVQARIQQQALAHERLLSELQDVRERVQREAELLVEDRRKFVSLGRRQSLTMHYYCTIP